MAFNVSENYSERFKLTEKRRVSILTILFIVGCIIGFLILFTYHASAQPWWDRGGPLYLIFINFAFIFFAIVGICYALGLKKDSYLLINNEIIEMFVSYRAGFKILWSEFDSVQILKTSRFLKVDVGLLFNTQDIPKSFKYTSPKDFKRRNNKKIFEMFELWCKKKGKSISIIKK